MAGHFLFRVSQTAQSSVDGVLAHGSGATADAGKHGSAVASAGTQVMQDGDGLFRERHDVRLAHLHALTRDASCRLVQAERAWHRL